MKIEKLILKNFRNFENETEIKLDDLSVIIGKNDLGKSSLLEALDIFINEKDAIVKLDIDDACKRSDSNEITIGVVFSNFPKKVDIDEGNTTSLGDEYLLNKDGLLEIHKTYRAGKNIGVYIKANHPTADGLEELMLKKREELKKIVEDKNIECENKTKNASLRKAIRQSYSDLELQEIYLSANEEDAKKTWDKLSQYLPVYALFQSDRPNRDGDSEIQDPMKLAIQEILKKEDLQLKLKEVALEVERISKQIAEKTLEKLNEMNPEIAKELVPVIPPSHDLKWDSVFKNIEISSDNGVPLNKRGSGVRRLVLLNFFRAQAEETATKDSKSHTIYAIEEPETSQHPNHQKILIKALKELSEQTGKQIFITTHSPSLIQLLPKESVKLLRKSGDCIEIVSGDFAISEIIDDMGVLPIIGKVAAFVEGENDRSFLLNLNDNIKELRDIVDLNKISIIPLGGSTLEKWVNRNYLDGSNIIEFHLYDKDADEKYKKAISKINDRGDNSLGKLTERLEMENYIHPSLVEKCERFKGINCTDVSRDWHKLDITSFIREHLIVYKTNTLSGNNKIDKDKQNNIEIKQIINCSLSKGMTKELMQDIGIWDEVKSWFTSLKSLSSITS